MVFSGPQLRDVEHSVPRFFYVYILKCTREGRREAHEGRSTLRNMYKEDYSQSGMYLKDLLDSIQKVDNRYYYHSDQQQCERAFAYELYNQWSKYIEEYRKKGDLNISINAEIPKFIDRSVYQKYPDLVMHEDGADRQEIVVEIKRLQASDAAGIIGDFQKLAAFMTGYIGVGKQSQSFMNQFSPYKQGVFIGIGNKDELLKKLQKHVEELHIIQERLKERKTKLICVCTTPDNQESMTIEDLHSLLVKKEKNQYNSIL